MLIALPFRRHLRTHEGPMECPAPQCTWGQNGQRYGADYGGRRDRHVWVVHRNWASAVGYPKNSRICDICGREYRKDNLKRHVDEVHRGTGRPSRRVGRRT